MIKLTIKVIPNAHKNLIEGFVDGVLKVRIKAPPEKGKANEELIVFLAKSFNIPKSLIHITSGHSSRIKKLEIQSDTLENFQLSKE